jgi:acetyl esterase/lipase
MKMCILMLACFGLAFTSVPRPATSFPLWPDGAPGSLGNAEKDIPTLTVYLPAPDQATGAAIVICPGGGYGGLANHEGEHYARWLNEHGVAGFVLKYRLGSAGYRHPIMLHDAARAVQLVRARAGEWKLQTNRIGIIGSSAGGHLASTLLTHFDPGNPDAPDPIERQSSRPDLGILCYPVITMGEHTHQGSKKNLLGGNPSPDLVRELSTELHVTTNTPPTFLWHTADDKAVPVENSLLFAQALRHAGVPFDLHVYQSGPHGLGLGSRVYGEGERHPWAANCVFWLRQHGFVK